ncbi:uncharacterized protein C2orf78 homolog [Suncus etruscus]|uniref:uncharacterized protein C2orf78 homolog n=1 Tax=Suncus etruscus TaxID=109475 RepID=UPI00211006DD|nr:uncharacterized protein C2orf78 homolog [Suncus etruscus]
MTSPQISAFFLHESMTSQDQKWSSDYHYFSTLTMSENFQTPSVLGTANSLQLSLAVVNNTASLAGSTCNYSRVSAPAVGSACLLPSAAGTSFQPLIHSADSYQQSNSKMLSGVSGQSQIFASAACYPSSIQWDISGSALKKSSPGDFTMTVTNQDPTVSSTSVAAQYHNTSHTTSTVPLYSSLSARLVERTPQCPPHNHSLLLPFQEGSQVNDSNHGTLRSLLSQELGTFLQTYGSISYPGGRGSVLQTYNNSSFEMVIQEVQPTTNMLLATNTGISCSVCSAHHGIKFQRLFRRTLRVPDWGYGRRMATEVPYKKPSSAHQIGHIQQEASPRVTGRKRWEVRENSSKKADESRQLETEVEIESKSVIPHTKRKTNPCELSQEPLKKPRSCLGMQRQQSLHTVILQQLTLLILVLPLQVKEKPFFPLGKLPNLCQLQPDRLGLLRTTQLNWIGSTLALLDWKPWAATSRSAPSQASVGTFLLRKLGSSSMPKGQSPANAQNLFLLKYFSAQPIPWRKPNVPRPVMSTPISQEQRAEREALKRKAQQEGENAAKNTCGHSASFL